MDTTASTLRKWVVLGSLGCLAPGELHAQHLSGRVVDDATGRRVSGAVVNLEAGGELVMGVLTDQLGLFRMSPPSGTFEIHVERLGYQPLVHEGLSLTSADTLFIELRIGAEAIPLESFTVVARGAVDERIARWGFFDRRERYKHGEAHFLKRADIEAKIPGRATDVFQDLLRVRIVGNGRLRQVEIGSMSRSCRPAVFLDGMYFRLMDDEGIDDLVTPGAMVAVEVYTSTYQIPAEYIRGPALACGVIAIWTGVTRQ